MSVSASVDGAASALPGEDEGQIGEGSRVAGRYRLVERLETRGGSVVWKAIDEVLARPVTMITLAPGSQCARDVMAAARAAARARDPRLSRVFDANDQAPPVHVVTEWPSGVSLGDLVAAGPLEPWRAARMITEAAQALAAAHEDGLAHLCLVPGSLRCGAQGEVTITGLAIDAALFGTRASDRAQADTSGLARLLYAALTGYWPGPEQTGLPAAPRPAGRVACASQLRPGIPASIGRVMCRALDGQARGDQPPISSPACLAAELAAITPPGPPLAGQPGALLAGAPSPVLTATLPMSPLPFLSVPVQPPVPPITRTGTAAPPAAVAGRAAQPAGRPEWTKRRRPRWGKPAVAALTLVVLAAGGWLLLRQLTASHHPGTAAGGAHGAASVVTVTPARAVAFGPAGAADGDNPQLAHLAIDDSAATSWQTDWYTTAVFGDLQDGTGLLLDLGHPVAVTQALITLGSTTGADLQLRAGNVPVLDSLRPVARAANAGGVVRLRLSSPRRARYLLIWFTKLPPDGSGTFQADIYQVRLQARG